MKAQEQDGLCVGIDLGTTNSVLSIINEKPNGDIISKVLEIPRATDMYNAVSAGPKLTTKKEPTLPSCVYYRQEKNYEPLVGDFAKMQYPLRPHLVAKSVKSQMGKAKVEGLSEDIPDKTPAEISARILKHLIREASKVCRSEIKDAVITVPANFDSIMCKATRDAAELAGIKVRNNDGSERPILLSEPNAVIYDLINQIHNGEISDRILDLSEKKRVLVFDLGGGTLDITMHQIQRRDDNEEVLKVDEIATNRYTLLGGDDFDEEIAKAMYKRYLAQYERYPDVVKKLRKEENTIMALLRVQAEGLKLEVNDRCGNQDDYDSGWDDSGWDDSEEETGFSIGGNMGGIGYSYDDTFTQGEVENILSVFMASELKYDDYKNLENISNIRNIIYPILDVLKKASDKLETEDVVVDAVIVNGGMSKFYMVTDRLNEFFGFDPIVALDPDQAVARGAAVYHYYLRKYDEMQDDMRLLDQDEDRSVAKNTSNKRKIPDILIDWSGNILNDSLYLGVKNGATHEIIPTGTELPYTSQVMSGFRIEAGKNKIAIPIKNRNLDGSYRTIANGNMVFKQRYFNGVYVAFMIHMSKNKVITMKAWTSRDVDGNNQIEAGIAEISIETNEFSKEKSRMIAQSGSRLQPRAEINHLVQLCQNLEKIRGGQGQDKNGMMNMRIYNCIDSICKAGNKEEFAPAVLDALENNTSEVIKLRLFVIAKKIGDFWSNDEKKRLARLCMSQISADITGFPMEKGPRVNTNIEAIYAMSICANAEQLSRLSPLHSIVKYRQVCLDTHAKTRTEIQWLQDEFFHDVRKTLERKESNIQFSAYAIGAALKKDGLSEPILPFQKEERIIQQLCKVIRAGVLSEKALICCVLSLGWISDQRENIFKLDERMEQEILDILENLDFFYPTFTHQEEERKVAMKMVKGERLTNSEEQFLLKKLER